MGNAARDDLWSHPDLVPDGDDISDPSALIARITATEVVQDDVDRAIEDLLGDDTSERPHED